MTPDFIPNADRWLEKPGLAYNVQIVFDAKTRRAFSDLQDEIDRRWPPGRFRCPADTLHITVHTLVDFRQEFEKAEYWKAVSAKCVGSLRSFCAALPPFDLRFSHVKVMPSAIIAVAFDNGTLAATRRTIPGFVDPAPGIPPKYDLIHTTLFRFKSAAPVPRAMVDDVEALPVAITTTVDRLSIIRERLYPGLAVDTIETFHLGG